MIANLWCRLARLLVRCAPRGRFAITEWAWTVASHLNDSESREARLDDNMFDLRPLQYRTEFHLYCLRDQFPNRDDASFTNQLVRPGDVVVDLGANIGNFAIPTAKAVAPSGRVIAVEPSLEIFRRLLQNLQRNPGINVVTFHIAIG